MTKLTIAQRLARSSAPDPSGCILWTARNINNKGYAIVCWEGRKTLAHRLAWIAVHGPVPAGMHVCHRCDRPLCINPDHLFMGTRSDNMMDCSVKGRLKNPRMPGVANPKAKITDEIAMQIYLASGKCSQIAKRFNASWDLVARIKKRETWKHIHLEK
jgi:HNH endonuclease